MDDIACDRAPTERRLFSDTNLPHEREISLGDLLFLNPIRLALKVARDF
jgi:hypothetical protein